MRTRFSSVRFSALLHVALIAALTMFVFGIASADVATPGCDSGIGNAAQLQADIAAINANNEDDVIHLSAGCIYDLTETLTIAADGGHTVTIEGNGATISGNLAVRVFYVNAGANLTLNNLTIRDGVVAGASGSGGGIRNEGKLILNGTTVTGNSAAFGGGIYNLSGGKVTLTNSAISGNHAEKGGGIENAVNGTVTLNNSIILGNTADINGGGLRNTGDIVLNYTAITGNAAVGDGGGYFGSTANAKLTLNESTLLANSASTGGGIANVDGATATLINTTVAMNTAQDGDGGGFFNGLNALATLNNVTFAENAAQVLGGGLFVLGGSTVNLSNSILAKSLGGDCFNGGVLNRTGGNLISDGTCAGAGVLSGDPMFGALTGFPDYLPLLTGSPAIDNGANNLCDAIDQRGKARPQDGDGNGVKHCDLGAYEADGIPVTGPVELDLLANGSFDAPQSRASLANWTVKQKTGDKGLCGPDMPTPVSGDCAFRFKGSASENAKLTQVVDLSAFTVDEQDTLALEGFFLGTSPKTKAKLTLSVAYVETPTPVVSTVVIGPQATYTKIGLPVMTIGAGTVQKITVTVNNKSKAGKLYVDSLSLTLTKVGAGRSTLLPLPQAPSDMHSSH